MKLILGLGNPGDEYARTRHNLGFMVLDAVAEAHHATWQAKTAFKSLVAEVMIGQQKALLAKPTTFYNLTGEAMQAITRFYRLSPEDIVAVHDELDLPFGMLRTRIGGRDAGNNGIKNIIEHCGEAFARIRIGIAPAEPIPSRQDFVLGRFTNDEQQKLPDIKNQAAKIIENFVRDPTSFDHTSIKTT